MKTLQYSHRGAVDIVKRNPHVRVRYRHNPPTGRVFIANSSKCVDAVVRAVSRRGIELIMSVYVAPSTPVRIEIGHSGPAPLMDVAAEVVGSTYQQDGTRLYACKWVRKLTTDELIAHLKLTRPSSCWAFRT